jgi:uncharacterized protein GlcG (DUF336 family)
MSIRPRARSASVIEALEPRALLATLLTLDEVELIIGQAASQARNRMAIAVSDRDGEVLGIFGLGNPTLLTVKKAVMRAQTAAFFESTQDAFTTRTARFIIQDHFPHPIENTPGGPLYGVEFSSLPGSDVFSGLGISGDPGGIPLFKDGQPVGGIGVAGDGNDIAVRQDLMDLPPFKVDNPGNKFYSGPEENDFDEQVALAGAAGFMAPEEIRATEIFLDGLRLPFTKDEPATANPTRTLDELRAAGVVKEIGRFVEGGQIHGSPGSPFTPRTIAGFPGELKNPRTASSTTNKYGFVAGNDPGGVNLNVTEVINIISNAVKQALKTRGAIRQPIGVPAQVHVAVVDRTGDILGVFKMIDGTNFSYDVAVQKARTAAFFSDDTHAFTARGIGFISQRFFPAGIDGGFTGPFYKLQNELSLRAGNLKAPLANGITIFPGGAPLYKNGQFVGAIGISGDGVNEDDLISFGGAKNFRPEPGIRCDALEEDDAVSFLQSKFDTITGMFNFNLSTDLKRGIGNRLALGLDNIQLPYVKFPRNPDV